jgi:hypothetical protein
LLDVFVLHLGGEGEIIRLHVSIAVLPIVLKDLEHVDISLWSVDDVDVLLPHVQELEHAFETLLHHLQAVALVLLHPLSLVLQESCILGLQSIQTILGLLTLIWQRIKDQLSVADVLPHEFVLITVGHLLDQNL